VFRREIYHPDFFDLFGDFFTTAARRNECKEFLDVVQRYAFFRHLLFTHFRGELNGYYGVTAYHTKAGQQPFPGPHPHLRG
jgi:hypothetical protein